MTFCNFELFRAVKFSRKVRKVFLKSGFKKAKSAKLYVLTLRTLRRFCELCGKNNKGKSLYIVKQQTLYLIFLKKYILQHHLRHWFLLLLNQATFLLINQEHFP